MPSRMIHYCVGLSILQKIDINKDLFNIGNLSPDAHDGSYNRKASTHFMTAYRDGIHKYPMADIEEYRHKYLIKRFDEFTLGYFCHLITDNLWTESVYYQYFEECNELEKKVKLSLCYDDYVTLNKILMQKYDIKKVDIFVPENLYVEEVNYDEIYKVIQNFYDDLTKQNSNGILKIFSYEFIDYFINKSSETCLNEIKNMLRNKNLLGINI